MKKVSSSPRKVKANPKRKKTSKADSYKVRNWPEYDQALKKRGSLTIWFSEEAIQQWHWSGIPKRGGQFTYSDLAIETALMLRAIFHQGFRQTEGLMGSIVELLKIDLPIPDHTTLSRRQAKLCICLPVTRAFEPLHVAVDSTGLKVYGEGEWKVRQHGTAKRRTWRKIHLAVDPSSGQIVASSLTTNGSDDASEVPSLLDQIKYPIDAFYGDGGYDKWKVYRRLANPSHQDTPIEPVIAPRKDARIKQHGNFKRAPLPRDETIRAIRQLGRKQWKVQSGYHQRSLAETTISRFKRIIGHQLRTALVHEST